MFEGRVLARKVEDVLSVVSNVGRRNESVQGFRRMLSMAEASFTSIRRWLAIRLLYRRNQNQPIPRQG